ncbi:MAG: hypothetical protein GF331_03735, partial [Chitinivibrionales bacterium]|nr:hypothetical protein [Chitinivibrionales bacterium]
MKNAFLAVALSACCAVSQTVTTPLMPYKDGEASPTGYSGSMKDIEINGAAVTTTGWIVFDATGRDLARTSSAQLELHVKRVEAPGTLRVHALDSAIASPENNVTLGDIYHGATAVATVPIGTESVETVLHIDVTSAVQASPFFGFALVSDDGLGAFIDSREGVMPPVVQLTYEIGDAAAKWYSGGGAPASDLGSDGDYYL